MAAVTELITKISFLGSTGPLKDYNNSLGKGIGLLAGMTATLGVAAFAVAKWASGISQSLQPLFDLSSQTGVAVAALQELSFAAEQSSSSSQALQSSISSLSGKIGEAAQKGSEEFSRLGISVRDANGNVKDADSILGEVGSSFRRLGLSMAEQQGFAEALGIDSSLITMLGKTGAELGSLKQRARDLGITISPKDQKALEDYNLSVAEMDSAMSGLKNKIAVAVVPMLGSLGTSFADVLADNSEWIDDGIEAAVELLQDLGGALKRTAPFVLGVGAAFAIAAIGTSGFAAALGIVFSPAVLIAAGLLAVWLILDDLIVAFRGGKSVIADFFMDFLGFDIRPVLVGIVDGFKKLFVDLNTLGMGFITGFVDIFSGIGDILSGSFAEGFASIGEGFMEMITSLGEFVETVFGPIFSFLSDGFSAVFEWAKEAVLGMLPDWVLNLVGADTGVSGTATPAASPAMQPAGAVTNVGGTSSNIEQTVNMEIRTSDPERAGRAAADGLQRQLSDAHTQTLRRSH